MTGGEPGLSVVLRPGRCPACMVNGRCQCTQPCGDPACEAAAEEAWMLVNHPVAMLTAETFFPN